MHIIISLSYSLIHGKSPFWVIREKVSYYRNKSILIHSDRSHFDSNTMISGMGPNLFKRKIKSKVQNTFFGDLSQ